MKTMETESEPRPLQPEYERWRWRIFFITWLGYVGFYFTRKAYAVAKIGILEDPAIEITKSSLGLIDGAYGVAYAIGQFMWGTLGDRFGSRRIVLAGMLGSVVVAVLFGLSYHFIVFGILLFFQGLCQASGWAPLTKNVSYWFARHERGRVYGFWSTNYAIGGMLASAFAGYMALIFGNWRYAFFSCAVVLVIIAALFFILQRNRPEDVGLCEIEEYKGEKRSLLKADDKDGDQEEEGSFHQILLVFKNPMILRLAAIYFLLKPTRYAILFWGPLIVYERLGGNIGQSALISAVFEAAGPIGVIFFGYASDKVFNARRMPAVIIGLFILSGILFSFSTITAGGGTLSMVLVLAAIGFFLFGPDALIASTSAVDFGTKKGAGSAVGFVNGMGSIGQILGLSLPGIISATWGWNVLFNGMGVFILLAALILLPKWNAVPPSQDGEEDQ
jgi:OPA family sugar phosphate sensor protein UhpC-like MFS transporter